MAGVRDFRDLVGWQLSHALKCEVFEFTSKPPVSRDFRYCDDIRASSASAPANIAERFGRFRPLPFAQFLTTAKASLQEAQNHLIDGHDRGYLDDRLFSRLWNLAKAAERATTNLLRSRQRAGGRRAPPQRAAPYGEAPSTVSETVAPYSEAPSTFSETAARCSEDAG